MSALFVTGAWRHTTLPNVPQTYPRTMIPVLRKLLTKPESEKEGGWAQTIFAAGSTGPKLTPVQLVPPTTPPFFFSYAEILLFSQQGSIDNRWRWHQSVFHQVLAKKTFNLWLQAVHCYDERMKNLKNCDFAVHNILCFILCFIKCSITATFSPYEDNSSASSSSSSLSSLSCSDFIHKF